MSDLRLKNEQLSQIVHELLKLKNYGNLQDLLYSPSQVESNSHCEANTIEHKFNIPQFKEISPLCSIPVVPSQYSQCLISCLRFFSANVNTYCYPT
jgi:hypothetical protein